MFQRSLLLLLIAGLLTCISLCACRESEHEGIASGKDTLLLYIMAGQSNMAGRAVIGPQDTNTNPRILVLDSVGSFVTAQEPLHHDVSARQGLDCGLSFAQNLLPQLPSNVRIGLLPCAVGSSSVEQWLGDSLLGNVHIYSSMMQSVRVAQQRGTLAGLLWFQGEANADDTSSRNYGKKLSLLVEKIRRDCGWPSLPVLSGKLPPFMHQPYRDSVNYGIAKAAAQLPGFFLVQTDDLSCGPDSLHFDAQAQRLLGQRFARFAASLAH
jgi:hypothetical protein